MYDVSCRSIRLAWHVMIWNFLLLSEPAVGISKTSTLDTQAVKTNEYRNGELNTCKSIDALEKVSASAAEAQPGVEEICSETSHHPAKSLLVCIQFVSYCVCNWCDIGCSCCYEEILEL